MLLSKEVIEPVKDAYSWVMNTYDSCISQAPAKTFRDLLAALYCTFDAAHTFWWFLKLPFCCPSYFLGRKGLIFSSPRGHVHLPSVHSWCHFITHISNISKHNYKCVHLCVNMVDVCVYVLLRKKRRIVTFEAVCFVKLNSWWIWLRGAC